MYDNQYVNLLTVRAAPLNSHSHFSSFYWKGRDIELLVDVDGAWKRRRA